MSTIVAKETLLENICILRYGSGLSENDKRFKEDLSQFLKFGRFRVTRQAIYSWFNLGRLPTRQFALEFLCEYVRKKVEFEDINSAHREIFLSVAQYFKDNIPRYLPLMMQTNPPEILSNIYRQPADLLRDNNLSGCYVTYRMNSRISNSRERAISRELLNISVSSLGEFRFDHWYQHPYSEMSKYNGAVVFVGDGIYLMGFSHDTGGHFRLIGLDRRYTQRRDASNIRWGIILTDNAVDWSDELSAARILLERIELDKFDDVVDFARRTVGYMAIEELHADGNKERAEIILRLIDNNVSAESLPGEITPTTEADGSAVKDGVLTIDARTLATASRILARSSKR